MPEGTGTPARKAPSGRPRPPASRLRSSIFIACPCSTYGPASSTAPGARLPGRGRFRGRGTARSRASTLQDAHCTVGLQVTRRSRIRGPCQVLDIPTQRERKNERHRPHRQQVQEAPGALPSPGLTPRAAGCSWSAGMDARAEQHVVSPLCLFSSTFCHSASVWHLPIVVQLCAEVDACSSASCLLVWTHAGELWGVGLLKGTAMGAGGHVPGVWLVLPSLPFTNS